MVPIHFFSPTSSIGDRGAIPVHASRRRCSHCVHPGAFRVCTSFPASARLPTQMHTHLMYSLQSKVIIGNHLPHREHPHRLISGQLGHLMLKEAGGSFEGGTVSSKASSNTTQSGNLVLTLLLFLAYLQKEGGLWHVPLLQANTNSPGLLRLSLRISLYKILVRPVIFRVGRNF